MGADPMSTRTSRYYRNEGLFELLDQGPAILESGLKGMAWSGIDWLGALIFIFSPPFVLWQTYQSDAFWLIAIAGILSIGSFFAVIAVLRYLVRRRRYTRGSGPNPIILSDSGVEEKISDEKSSFIPWADIRVIKKRSHGSVVQGRARGQSLSIDNRLKAHDEAVAIIEFVFVLSRQMGDWPGVTSAIRQRLQTDPIRFFYNSKREHAVLIDSFGLAHEDADGALNEISWGQIKKSVMDDTRSHLEFRHVSSRTTLTVPKGFQDPVLFDQFMRWAMHSEPTFGLSTE